MLKCSDKSLLLSLHGILRLELQRGQFITSTSKHLAQKAWPKHSMLAAVGLGLVGLFGMAETGVGYELARNEKFMRPGGERSDV